MIVRTILHLFGLMFKFIYSLLGLGVGLGCIMAGIELAVAGAAGQTSWTASLVGFKTELHDASPGVVAFVVGVAVVWITRFKFKSQFESSSSESSGRDNFQFVKDSIQFQLKRLD
jgi:hypothetical protein